MQNQSMDRTRLVFLAIVGVAVLAICLVGAATLGGRIFGNDEEPTAQVNAGTPQSAGTPTVKLESPNPVYAPATDLNDGLPSYICGADAFGSYFTLQQMQMSGTDVEHGFHLGIIPFFLDDNPDYDVSEEQRTALLNSGQWDCLLTTIDSVALKSPGIITAIVDESAGADQLWGRDIVTINELDGKRIAFAQGSVGEYFMYYALSIARLNPRFDVTLVPQDSVADAVTAFNNGQADAVSGWEPDIYEAESSGGVPILSSNQMRIVVDVIVTSRQSINGKTDLVQSFHDAWFDTLGDQFDNFDAAATQIASWEHNDWSFVYPESASDDLRLWLESVAQADLGDNAFVMRDTTPLVRRLEIARRVWATSGLEVAEDNVAQLVDPSFVSPFLHLNLICKQMVHRSTTVFLSPHKSHCLGWQMRMRIHWQSLPCRRFSFVPESTELTLESRRILDDCVVPTLSQSVGLFLRVQGSSAWPQNDPPYTEAEIEEFAEARAQSVVDYLVTQGIDPTRFIVEAVLPPEDHRNTEDAAKQAEDRFVEMTLITVGR